MFEWPEKRLMKTLSEGSAVLQAYAASVLLECYPVDAVTKWIVDPQVRSVVAEFSPIRNIDIAPCLSSLDLVPVAKSTVFVSSEGPTLNSVVQVLLASQIVAMDSEWRPEPPFKPATLQVFVVPSGLSVIFDLPVLFLSKRFQQFMGELFESAAIIKVGHTFLLHDLRNLRVNYPLPCLVDLRLFFDIVDLHLAISPKSEKTSLQFLCCRYLSTLELQHSCRTPDGQDAADIGLGEKATDSKTDRICGWGCVRDCRDIQGTDCDTRLGLEEAGGK